MHYIEPFTFDETGIENLKKHPFGTNWPVVYILAGKNEIYIGQSTNVHSRLISHKKNIERISLTQAYLLTDESYNMSAAFDIESFLIQYIAADGKFVLQNKNKGIVNHNYFDKEMYEAKYDNIWADLINFNIVENSLMVLENSDLFKYSPYKALSEDQLDAAEQIQDFLKDKNYTNAIVHGGAGTGKTILATYLIKTLVDLKKTKKKVALVVPVTPLRATLKKVFRNIKNLSSSMVIGPSEVAKNKYDILLIDEAHRLKQRKNITGYKSYDENNIRLGLHKEATELDWIMQNSAKRIFFYDERQSVRPSDVDTARFETLDSLHIHLQKQLRIQYGEEYEKAIHSVIHNDDKLNNSVGKYDFKLYKDFAKMRKDILKKETELGLCRIVAGYAWEWKSKNDKDAHDIEIDGVKMQWNSVAQDWVNSKNSLSEVGCIHTIQGYDLNYVGVIIGPELSYDWANKKFIINKHFYFDKNGYRGIVDASELERYILNIYNTLLKRGVHGCYVYCVDKDLERYFETKIDLKR